MSRIGIKPVAVPAGVKVSIDKGAVNVEGKNGKLSINLPPMTTAELKDSSIHVGRENDTNQAKAMHGLARSLINNMILGVSSGFRKDLQIVGVGYKAQLAGSKLTLSLGYSHPVMYEVPKGLKVVVTDNVKISIEGADKQLVGEAAATIRRFRKPEPYKGKGVRYSDEHITMKEGKTVGK